jgi:hypothetical protein
LGKLLSKSAHHVTKNGRFAENPNHFEKYIF